ncbi:hypothetical protein M0R45_011094 [Rubus argutus]|uniref:Uncharacterized protein n=1 Tax=Rubus argutus TaxID=59490 RepID=A0AAW1Y8V5_RUBAR
MNTPLNRNNDLEAEASPLLYPTMTESPELRWGFIRKVYAILTVQLLVTIAVAATVYIFRPISSFFARTVLGLSLYFTIIVTSLLLIAMLFFGKKQPLNHFHLGIFTICLSLMVGMSCAFTSGKVIVEAAILTAVIFLSLSLYTFWTARRGHDFSFLGPFLFAALTGLLVFGLIEFFYPVDNVTNGVVGIITFCGYVVYETENLIKRYKHDEYISAAIVLYLDILNLFLKLVRWKRRLLAKIEKMLDFL